jgi:hypothetical protein
VTDVSATSRDTSRERDGRVVLVTIDGVRWQDVFETPDTMPRTQALVLTRGVALGADLPGCGATVHTASGANVSLPGYQEIFTGHASRCLDNGCAPVGDSLLDEAARAGIDGVASIGSWEVLDRAVSGGRAGVFVADGRAWPAPSLESGSVLDDLVAAGEDSDPFPGYGGYRPDAKTAAIALEYFRENEPALFHVGLGDTDEWAHRDARAEYLQALRSADDFIGDLAAVLGTMGVAGDKTTVIVTPDHGRAANFKDHGPLHPESGRTFLLAFGEGIEPRGVTCPDRDVTLADIAPTIRAIMGLPRDESDDGGVPIGALVPRRGPEAR